MKAKISAAMRCRAWLAMSLALALAVSGAACGAEESTQKEQKEQGETPQAKPLGEQGAPREPGEKTEARDLGPETRIVLLHHSTGECIWNGGVAAWFQAYNEANKTRYAITEQAFPKDSPYGWENYPYDYWNIWVRHAGPKAFKEEPTLEMLTKKYDVIVWKHCFPVSNIEADTGSPDVASSEKRLENYRLQYAALKKKMREFPKVRFIVWTGAVQVKDEIDEETAKRARTFFDWVRTTWDEKGDNIYVWDFYSLETEGELYLKRAYASGDAHPNEAFSKKAAPLLCRRIVDVIKGAGDTTSILGGKITDEPADPETPVETAPTEPDETAPQESPAPADPTPAVKPPAAEPGTWVMENAEDNEAGKRLWAGAAGYAKDGGDNVVGLRFAEGREEDWGEYGHQRIIETRPPAKNYDVSGYRYVALRVKVDRPMELVLTLITLPDPAGPRDQSHFGFTAYMHPPAGRWQTVALDLGKLELTTEGDAAYDKAGKPARPMHLSLLRFVTNRKNEAAGVLIDDITFYRDLPEALRASLQAP